MKRPSHAWRSSRSTLIVLLVVVTACIVLARILLFRFEFLYGESRERYANFLVAAAVLLTGIALSSAYRPPSRPASRSPEGAVDEKGSEAAFGTSVLVLGGTLTAALAAIGVVQLSLPATPYRAAAPACPGVPVVAAPFLAQTQAGGVNARSGPGTDYPQRNRFPGGCTLGFDGYCIGAAVEDKKTDLYDVRWLLVHDRDYLVSSAKLLDQSPLTDLGDRPHHSCSGKGGTAQPGRPEFTATITSPGEAAMTVSADNAAMVGYAVHVLDAIDGYEYSAIKIKPRSDGFAGVWDATTAAAVLRNGTGKVELAAATCLAVDAPGGEPAVYLATFEDDKLINLTPTEPLDPGRLATAACSGPP